jgi:peptidoglycan/LPS O-acetylase OafA/YrhL
VASAIAVGPGGPEETGLADEGARLGFGYKPGLDGLRAVAVLSVMAFHFGASWATGGFLGVDMFFVLSGYLITSLLVVEWDRTSTLHFAAFWARRARRLLPALFLVLIAIAIWAAIEAHSDQLDGIRTDSLWTLLYGANWRFVTSGQSYFDMFRDASPLRHAWSLAIEEQFYLVWPLVTFLCLRIARGRRWLLATACVTGVVASSLLMARWYDSADPSRAYYGTDTRAGQLLLGALLGLLLLGWSPRSRRAQAGVQAAGLVGVAFCVWAFAVFTDRDAWLYRGGFLLFAFATALVIAAVVQPHSPLHAILSFRAVRWVGAISYGLYLWHWPVAVAVTEGRTGLTGWSLAAVRVGLTFGAATLSYYLLELPVRRGTWLRGRVAYVVAPIAGITTAVVIVVATNGGTAPPQFLVARPNSVVTTPRLSAPVAPLRESESQLGVAKMLLLGDSVADTLGSELQLEAARHGVELRSVTRPGCGMTTDTPLRDDGTPVPWGSACGDATAEYQSGMVANETPDVVLWLSTWETSDAIFKGQEADFGTQAGDRALLAELEEARTRIEAGGARLVLLTVPPPADTSEVKPLRPDEAPRRRHLNELFERFAALHPSDVAVADLASIVCPSAGTSCPATVDGVVLRPRDGNHFQGGGPAWVAPRLYEEIIRALSALAPAQLVPDSLLQTTS